MSNNSFKSIHSYCFAAKAVPSARENGGSVVNALINAINHTSELWIVNYNKIFDFLTLILFSALV